MATREPGRMWLQRLGAGSGPILAGLIGDPDIAPNGFAERSLHPQDMISADAFVWEIRTGAGPVGLVWLDTCTAHYSCVECGMVLTMRGSGFGPVAFAAVVLYAVDLLAVSTVCFCAKGYNRQVVRMCERAGIEARSRHLEQDDYHPDGACEYRGYLVDREKLADSAALVGRVLRRPVVLIDTVGRPSYVAAVENLSHLG